MPVRLRARATEHGPRVDGVGGAAVVTLSLVVLAMPFGGGFPLTDDPYPHYRAVPWLDLAWLALIVAAAPLVARRVRDRTLGGGAALWGLIVVLLAASFALQPSAIGAQTVLRAFGILAAAGTIAEMAPPQRAFVLAVLALVVVFEFGVAVAQVVAGGPIGMLGESPGLSPIRGNAMVARGTFMYEYIYAGLGLVAAGLFIAHASAARPRAAWLALAGLAATAAGMTFSRIGLIGVVGGSAALVLGEIRSAGSTRYRWALVALLVGVGAPALILREGWLGRAIEGVAPSQQAVTERVGLASQALTLIAEHPVLGVGTGRYVAAARERFPGDPGTHSVHNVPLMLAAEAGVAAGALAVALGVVLAWRAARAGPAPLALYLMFVPAMLFDVYPLITAQGTVITGIWIGALDAAARRDGM